MSFFQTASGAAHPSGTFHLCDRTEPPRTDEAQGIERFEHFTLPLRVPAVFSRFLLRRGIGGSVLDRSANATRDFSAQAEAFRRGIDEARSTLSATETPGRPEYVAVIDSSSERLSTLPGHVAPDAPSRGALHFPTLGRSISTKGGATNSPHTSEIAEGRSIGPSRRPVTIHGGNVQSFMSPTIAALIISAPTGRKETNDVAISLQAGRPMPLNRQAEDVLIDLEIWRRKALADNGRIDPEEAMEALPMVEEAQRILNLMAPTWGQINSMLDAATGMFSPKVQRNNREIVSRYPDNIVAFPVARDHAAGD